MGLTGYMFSFSFGCGCISLINTLEAKELPLQTRENLTYISPVAGFCNGVVWGSLFGPFAMLNYIYYAEEIQKSKILYKETEEIQKSKILYKEITKKCVSNPYFCSNFKINY